MRAFNNAAVRAGDAACLFKGPFSDIVWRLFAVGAGDLGRDAGADPDMWFGEVERFSARSSAARDENRTYVSRILRELEPAYIAVGWPGKAVCP